MKDLHWKISSIFAIREELTNKSLNIGYNGSDRKKHKGRNIKSL